MKFTKEEMQQKANDFLEIQRRGNAQQECWYILTTLAAFFRCSPDDIQRTIARMADGEHEY